jgi:hypothetical protein
MIKEKTSQIAAAIGLTVALTFCVTDPLGLSASSRNYAPYEDLYRKMKNLPDTSVLLIASYNDYYDIPINHHIRNVLNDRFFVLREMKVERGYDEVLSYASLGETEFGRFLYSRSYQYILVPGSTVESGHIFHRWSNRGGIDLSLVSGMFQKIADGGGDFPLALYKINYSEDQKQPPVAFNYHFVWGENSREAFHRFNRDYTEIQKPTYAKGYEDGIDVGWVFAKDLPEFSIYSNAAPTQKFSVELQIVAAYGASAPSQVVRITTSSGSTDVDVSAGVVTKVQVVVTAGEKIAMSPTLGCHLGIEFDPAGQDKRNFCFGVHDIVVRPIN